VRRVGRPKLNAITIPTFLVSGHCESPNVQAAANDNWCKQHHSRATSNALCKGTLGCQS
jgi:hypothetical protein